MTSHDQADETLANSSTPAGVPSTPSIRLMPGPRMVLAKCLPGQPEGLRSGAKETVAGLPWQRDSPRPDDPARNGAPGLSDKACRAYRPVFLLSATRSTCVLGKTRLGERTSTLIPASLLVGEQIGRHDPAVAARTRIKSAPPSRSLTRVGG